jgi:hypothetical protein
MHVPDATQPSLRWGYTSRPDRTGAPPSCCARAGGQSRSGLQQLSDLQRGRLSPRLQFHRFRRAHPTDAARGDLPEVLTNSVDAGAFMTGEIWYYLLARPWRQMPATLSNLTYTAGRPPRIDTILGNRTFRPPLPKAAVSRQRSSSSLASSEYPEKSRPDKPPPAPKRAF